MKIYFLWISRLELCHIHRKGIHAIVLINGVQAYFEEKGSFNNKRSNIHLIGRLDKETSGILGIAKNSVTAEKN
ncbi:MAG: pseudouridine synthase [Anaerobutyricum hallii]